jgi:Family of unknown function (DUF5752)
MPDPFAIKDCALTAIATGRRAQNLRELGAQLYDAHPGCLYFHFWGNRLRPRFDAPEFQNDFAAWARHSITDHPLSERLGIVDPTEFRDLEELRVALIEIIEDRLGETEMVPWARHGAEFVFIRSQIVVFDTSLRFETPESLRSSIRQLPGSAFFYHFIDARRRHEASIDDFSAWLVGFGGRYDALIGALAQIDPYFSTLTELRDRVAVAFEENLPKTPPPNKKKANGNKKTKPEIKSS